MEEIWLPDHLLALPLGSATLWECLAARLPWSQGSEEYTIEFGGNWNEEPPVPICLRWDSQTTCPYPWGVPEQTITELAACGLALILCALFLESDDTRIVTQGDSFDYWLHDRFGWYGLEVSGTLASEPARLRSRALEKKRQLLRNTQGLSGYVVAVGFSIQRILFSAHNFGDDE
ncbi:MAG: hypothetical protein QM758_15740 [Armatimonas sp.]